ncbi:pyridoxamine 5'-phosphate oxidase family protein [soil metagenome]
MSRPTPVDEAALRARVLAVIDGRHLMALATNRADGWPQVTLVNYLRQDRALYFVVARDSQKFANVTRDPRVSIAIGGGPDAPYSLSMAAHVTAVDDFGVIDRLNRSIWALPPEAGFTPHPSASSIVVLQARPEIISLVDYTTPPGHRELLNVGENWTVRRQG